MSQQERVRRLLRDAKSLLDDCAWCRDHPRWVTVAKADDSFDPPEPCPQGGSVECSIIVVGAVRLPGDPPLEDDGEYDAKSTGAISSDG